MIRVGTRASALARTQSSLVADAITAATGEETVLVTVSTEGDRSSAPLAELAQATGGVGVFVSALREALLAGEVDVAVHSLKDLPTAPATGVELAAVPEREDPRDVLVTRAGRPGDPHGAPEDPLAVLPDGARVGTGSPRRAAMLRAAVARRGRTVEVVDVRGNVDTRLARVHDDLDGVVLAAAGLRRLGVTSGPGHVLTVLDPADMLPAPGQGALAVECREGDPLAARLRAALDHAPTRAATTAERRLLAVLDTGCSAPVGALARVEGDTLVLEGAATGEGPLAADVLRVHLTAGVADAADAGQRAGRRLLAARDGGSTTARTTQPQHEESLR